jgi:hypothetical protein
MNIVGRRAFARIVAAVALTLASVVTGSGPAGAVEAGQAAPDFKLPSSMGSDISLSDFRGKKWVLVEFYGADFVPT